MTFWNLLLGNLSLSTGVKLLGETMVQTDAMQHCWPTTLNIVGCYMLRPFAHPVACCWMLFRVVAQSLKPVKLLASCKRA